MKKVLAVLLMGLGVACYAGQIKGRFVSPDAKSVAIVESVKGESKVEIEQGDTAIAQASYASESGNNGQAIETVGWSPDSRYFVYGTYSSGGHQSWSVPIYFYDATEKAMHCLDEFLPPTADTAFTLSAPDKLTVTIWTPCGKEDGDGLQLPITFALSDLKKAKEVEESK
jgi:hypothetical protein